jgi:hypothetical protein
MERSPTLEPIRARKAAWVLITPDRTAGHFAGLSVHLGYQADDLARCAPDRCQGTEQHDPPHRDSSCGFHSAVHDPVSWLLPDAVLLDVELFGRVIRHERGWRASRQRVLGAAFPRACREYRHREDGADLVTLPSRVLGGWWTVGSRCQPCSQRLRTPTEGRPITMGELAGILGTEVSWADPATTNEALRYLRAA